MDSLSRVRGGKGGFGAEVQRWLCGPVADREVKRVVGNNRAFFHGAPDFFMYSYSFLRCCIFSCQLAIIMSKTSFAS